ncbi:MAG: HDOD domain-containing protein [bacterium]|nr:HDOD domain-containing protein [bacterium]
MSDTNKLDYILDEIVTLPSLPTAVARITQLVQNPDADLGEIGKAISADPSIALKTLRLVNSAYYGVRQKVSSVGQAVTLLGLKVIKNLVLTATVFDSFQQGADQLLRHSVACGIAMKVLTSAKPGASKLEADDAFVFGLLHDIGKIIFEGFLAKEFEDAVQMSRARQIPLYKAEREVIGADHAEMGAVLAIKWKLPDELAGAIAGHHDLNKCEDDNARKLAALLAIANYMCAACGLASLPKAQAELSDSVWTAAGLSVTDVPKLVDAFTAELPALDEMVQAAS